MEVLTEVLTNGGIFVLRTWLRYLIVCGGIFGLTWVLLAGPLRHRRCQDAAPDWTILRAELLNSLVGIIFFVLPSALSIPLYLAGYLRLEVGPLTGHPAWLVFTFILVVIGADAWFYWTHRAMHDSRIYAWTHKLHHLSTNPSPLASYSFSMIEGFVLGLYLPLILLVFPINRWILAVFVLYFAITEAYVHLGYELAPRRFASNIVTKWIGTSVFHNMHHENGAYNFGVYFTWWDRMMGTMHPEYEARFDKVTRKPLLSLFHRDTSPS